MSSRILECTECGDPVEVIELPVQHIDPRLYVCGQCIKPMVAQREIVEGHRVEIAEYNPQQAELPF